MMETMNKLQTHFTSEIAKIRSRLYQLETHSSPDEKQKFGSFSGDYHTGSFARPQYQRSPMTQKREQPLWSQVQELLVDEKLNEAYKLVF